MQWCTRFTQLLPDATHRERFVEYMRQLRNTARSSLEHNLRDADLVTGGDRPQPPVVRGDDEEKEEKGVVAPCKKISVLSKDETNALVVITATALAMHRACVASVASSDVNMESRSHCWDSSGTPHDAGFCQEWSRVW